MADRTAAGQAGRTAARDGRPVLVVGLGRSGRSVLRWLGARGVRCTATDSRPAPADADALRAEFPQVEFHFGGHAVPEPVARFRQLVVSPGVPLQTPLVVEACAAGVEVIGDIELFARALPAGKPVIGITGTNGKSTVTTLVGEMARAAGIDVGVGGNLGTPALDLLARGAELYLLELSSFQLETTSSLAVDVAVWLNLSEDHLDRHGTLEAYAAAKARVFRGARRAVVNGEDPVVMRYAPQDAIRFGLTAPAAGAYGLLERDGAPWLAYGGEALLAVSELRIVGLQNVANALAALAAADVAGIPRAAALSALRAFEGLPHRCERVAQCRGVTWINDSKGTNVGATLAALRGFPQPIVWLGGGQGKGQDFMPLRAALHNHARAALLFGIDAPQLATALAGAVPVERVADLDAALLRAAELAQPGDCVLLSPACASLDQFTNYAERGQRFRDGVRARCAGAAA